MSSKIYTNTYENFTVTYSQIFPSSCAQTNKQRNEGTNCKQCITRFTAGGNKQCQLIGNGQEEELPKRGYGHPRSLTYRQSKSWHLFSLVKGGY